MDLVRISLRSQKVLNCEGKKCIISHYFNRKGEYEKRRLGTGGERHREIDREGEAGKGGEKE